MIYGRALITRLFPDHFLLDRGHHWMLCHTIY